MCMTLLYNLEAILKIPLGYLCTIEVGHTQNCKLEEDMSQKRGHESSSNSSEEETSSEDREPQSGSEQNDSELESRNDGHGHASQTLTSINKPKSKRPRQDIATDSSDSDSDDCRQKWPKTPRKDGLKWDTLEHHGPIFPSQYEPLPDNVRFKYDGINVNLSPAAEEAARYYARFHGHDYTKIETFNKNFFGDWQYLMTSSEKEIIRSLDKCDFSAIHTYILQKAEERKAMSKEDKEGMKRRKEEIQRMHGTCIVDGEEVKIGNYSVEPPGLFIGRGNHPKMGMIKKRIQPEDVTINCGIQSKYPIPPEGHNWKMIQFDQKVSWLACWTENIFGKIKYIQLHQTSDLKGEKDFQKYEKARELSKKIDTIRSDYRKGWSSHDLKIRERSVAMYFIDKLSLRAGNEKGEGTADTVGCCSLRCGHIKLHDEMNIVAFDFLGKDSIPYKNSVPVEEAVFCVLKNLMKDKPERALLFSHINPSILNQHLSELMKGLTAKVFRTCNASHTLQQQLDNLTKEEINETVAVDAKLLAYNRANRMVAVLCNHQRTVPKTFDRTMENLRTKIQRKSNQIDALEDEFEKISKDNPRYERKKQFLAKSRALLNKWKYAEADKVEGKEIALGTSKLNYLDPRITVTWCKKHNIPLEKVYNKTQRAKFHWAIEMADENFKFD